MIGLKRYTVEVVEHHPGWAALASRICQDVRHACGELLIDVQHVGSTSVPGLPAKPIIDIAMAVDTLDVMSELVTRLTGIDYIYRGDGGDNGGHLFVKESAPDVRTIHLHVVIYNGSQWKNYLRFRDVLRKDAHIRERYAELKMRLRDRFSDDRKSYTASKHEFIRSVLDINEVQQRAEMDVLTGTDSLDR